MFGPGLKQKSSRFHEAGLLCQHARLAIIEDEDVHTRKKIQNILAHGGYPEIHGVTSDQTRVVHLV